MHKYQSARVLLSGSHDSQQRRCQTKNPKNGENIMLNRSVSQRRNASCCSTPRRHGSPECLHRREWQLASAMRRSEAPGTRGNVCVASVPPAGKWVSRLTTAVTSSALRNIRAAFSLTVDGRTGTFTSDGSVYRRRLFPRLNKANTDLSSELFLQKFHSSHPQIKFSFVFLDFWRKLASVKT